MQDRRAGAAECRKRVQNGAIHLVGRKAAAVAGNAHRLQAFEPREQRRRGHIREQHCAKASRRQTFHRVGRAREVVAVESDQGFLSHFVQPFTREPKAMSVSRSAGRVCE